MTKEEAFLQRLLDQRQHVANAVYFFFKQDELIFISRKLNCSQPFDAFTYIVAQGDVFELEKNFIETYQPRFNVQQATVNVFDYYKQHISVKLSGVQMNKLIEWNNSLPNELVVYAMDRTIKRCPDEPFNYLKYLIESWLENGYRTIEDVEQNEPTYPSKKQTKGNERHAEYERSVAKNGHYKGIPEMDF